ncbi:MAG: glycoside hydrolase family 32 protein [Promethearchaeota archaeon]
MEFLEEAQKIAQNCSLRPKFHFIAPANWMNDPNGPVYYKEEYHIFYQFNPYGEQWGDIHWGHAKSKDLVQWEHLPIALTPSINKGESHCYSGCCAIIDGVPTILYTSIGPNMPQTTNSEQWIATSSDDMMTWQKSVKNPIMTKELHDGLEIRDWRDPFIWRKNDAWYAILSGHFIKPRNPVVMLYKSTDFYNWEFISPLLVGNRKLGRNWECPNFFSVNNKHVIIVSPHNKVIYTVGEFKNQQFTSSEWNILDHGQLFYATNVMKDPYNRIILWAWIQAKGTKGWNGCLTLPRVLTLSSENKLRFKVLPELKSLRVKQYSFHDVVVSQDSTKILPIITSSHLEIKIEVNLRDAESLGLKLFKSNFLIREESIGYDSSTSLIWSGKDNLNFDLSNNEAKLTLHVFIDNSIVEVFINDCECITSQIVPKNESIHEISLFTLRRSVKINSLDIWELKSIF